MVTTRSHAADPLPPPASLMSESRSSGAKRWSHTPTPLTLLWLFISIPFVIWDTLYVLLRPHTMPGGHLHSPVWKGYALYGAVDYVYGWPALEANDGFTAAQSSLNIVETLGYMLYLWIVWKEGSRDGKEPGMKGRVGDRVEGRWAAAAVLAGFAFSVMTLSKTVLYGMNEFHSGYKNIGHNDASTIFFIWIVPNGAWIALPAYMVYVFGSNILEGLAIASESTAERARTNISHKEE